MFLFPSSFLFKDGCMQTGGATFPFRASHALKKRYLPSSPHGKQMGRILKGLVILLHSTGPRDTALVLDERSAESLCDQSEKRACAYSAYSAPGGDPGTYGNLQSRYLAILRNLVDRKAKPNVLHRFVHSMQSRSVVHGRWRLT